MFELARDSLDANLDLYECFLRNHCAAAYMTSSKSSSYSSLFTAGLFGLGAWAHPTAQASAPGPLAPPPLLVPTPPSPSKKTFGTPRRTRRRSSASIASSPMSAIKSPAQRVSGAQRRALASPGQANFPGNNMWPLPEQQTLSRPRRAHLPPSRKPPPTAPLPDIPQLNFNSSTRKDSLTLPPPSPTVLGFHSRSGESFAPAMQSGIANLLSPSPNFQNSRHLTVKVPSGRHMADLLSSPILGSFNDIPEDEGNDHAIAN